jgi:hypothetical protein
MQGDVALVGPPVGSVTELLARLVAIDAALPPADGLACFNRMYRQVTVAVQGRLAADFFADPAFMEHLDVAFGNLYLDAVRASVTQPERVPRSWAALLEQRGNPRIAPLQFALAGMNAHINHDLPIAVGNTCRDLRSPPDAGSHRADYERVNPVLADLDGSVRESFETGPLLRLDRNVRTLADIVVNWDIVHARETAWANAEALWGLRQGAGPLAETYLDGLDHLVGFAGRGLLVPLVAV